MKKRASILLLVFCLTLLLALPAAAVSIQLSNQSVTLNGVPVYAQAYNIEGSNYFRLRDVAYLLRDTAARFSVEYSAQHNTVSIVTGADYSPIGTELDVNGSKDPRSVVASPQSLIIDGNPVSRLSAYNVDGSNYYRLRDLGEELGFSVDYDRESRTVLITTGPEAPQEQPVPEDWAPDISFSTMDSEGNEWTDACFRDAKLTMINLWAYWCGPCTGEMPDLQQLYEDYRDEGLQILGISDKEYEEDNNYVVEQLGITYPCLRYTYAFDAHMNTGYIPTTIFVDSSGRVVDGPYIGSNSYEGWAEIIESLLP